MIFLVNLVWCLGIKLIPIEQPYVFNYKSNSHLLQPATFSEGLDEIIV